MSAQPPGPVQPDTSGPLRGVIALDGPSGTGKSTVARALATSLDASYLDTGAMYRAATLAVLRAALDPEGPEAATLAAGTEVRVGTDPTSPTVALAQEDVADEIRGAAVTGAVSAVSAHPVVREHLVTQQRRIIDATLASGGGIVVEGRDIGTVVAPDAGLKVYLTAADEVRAARRGDQDRAAGRGGDPAATLVSVRRRDALDSGRAHSPLRAAPDAITVDTSTLDVDGVLAEVRALARTRGLLAEAGGRDPAGPAVPGGVMAPDGPAAPAAATAPDRFAATDGLPAGPDGPLAPDTGPPAPDARPGTSP